MRKSLVCNLIRNCSVPLVILSAGRGSTNYCIENGCVTSVLFKNGIELQFFTQSRRRWQKPGNRMISGLFRCFRLSRDVLYSMNIASPKLTGVRITNWYSFSGFSKRILTSVYSPCIDYTAYNMLPLRKSQGKAEGKTPPASSWKQFNLYRVLSPADIAPPRFRSTG